MGEILFEYKKSIVDDLIETITGENSRYYAFASNPTEYTGNTPTTNTADYYTGYENNWNMMFGKKLSNTDVIPMIRNIEWANGTVYTPYRDKQDLSNTEFYVVVPPEIVGGYYHVYKCIDNANGANSTQIPDIKDNYVFTLIDGYSWRYIYSISSSNYAKFATTDYIPVHPNNSVVEAAYDHSGVDVILIANGGTYDAYHSGLIVSVPNTTLVQISSNSSLLSNFYTNSAIYIYTTGSPSGQLRTITEYVSNSIGNWCYLAEEIDVDLITPTITQYKIAPSVIFDTDGDGQPSAYLEIDPASNSISNVIIIDTGYGITRADATVIANSSVGSGGLLTCVVPPPGGHGSDPASELHAAGIGISFSFVETEGNTILTTLGNSSVNTTITYNKIGLIKDPRDLHPNSGLKMPTFFSSNTFSQILQADFGTELTVGELSEYQKDDLIVGKTSGAKGKIVFCNTSAIFLVGDKDFSNGEIIQSTTGGACTTINIVTRGDIYTRDLRPLYVENINDVTRSDDQSESFKLIIQV